MLVRSIYIVKAVDTDAVTWLHPICLQTSNYLMHLQADIVVGKRAGWIRRINNELSKISMSRLCGSTAWRTGLRVSAGGFEKTQETRSMVSGVRKMQSDRDRRATEGVAESYDHEGSGDRKCRA